MAMQTSTDSAPTMTMSADGQSPVTNSPTASPPLILAFLSVALFSAGIIAVLGWKRVHFVNSAGHWGFYFGSVVPSEGFGSIPAVVDIGEEPRLWDLHTNYLKDVVIGGGNKQLEEGLLQHHPSLLFVKPFRGCCEDDHKTVSSRTSIQVAVAIALPSPHHRTLRREGRNDGSEREDREDKRMGEHLEYVIGLSMECSKKSSKELNDKLAAMISKGERPLSRCGLARSFYSRPIFVFFFVDKKRRELLWTCPLGRVNAATMTPCRE
ncbi:uncharacterized protein LACBIDRAFT_327243 [Laccaria bicolor S238N-H82]|uniref:Predicted protein n=1 Tax=Laccaria bicolor (strain S238N-H82 / ATCC MYA-4686) TaxID=486041 RepID=B0DBL1_LACBS|nr:uncharacterized protein LACBIDRAFT_327243 [Laccaria bicolor S238N-H82]EDR08018.1 predicted protein [Laccaria bicolor S238N-H82]|eukprot:XP_001881088.1 predicted protein [Laccaria bicolor S238N-H82]